MTPEQQRTAWTVKKSPSHNGYSVNNESDPDGISVSVFAPYGGAETERREKALAVANRIAATLNQAA